MSKGTINKVMLLGRLGADPEVRYMPSGSAVANIRIATNDGYKDKQSGQFVETTEWHRVVLFGRLAEIAGQYLQKGRLVFVEGRIRTNKWQDQSGQDRYSTEIVANEMQLVGGSGGQRDDMSQDSPFDQTAQAPSNQSSAKSATKSAKSEPVPAPNMADFDKFDDDDIPF